MIWRILAVIVGFLFCVTSFQYSLELAGAKSHLWFVGVIAFVLTIWLFLWLIAYVTKPLLKSIEQADEDAA